jgi:hypothetical protein
LTLGREPPYLLSEFTSTAEAPCVLAIHNRPIPFFYNSGIVKRLAALWLFIRPDVGSMLMPIPANFLIIHLPPHDFL